jgi:hypothetical protein
MHSAVLFSGLMRKKMKEKGNLSTPMMGMVAAVNTITGVEALAGTVIA